MDTTVATAYQDGMDTAAPHTLVAREVSALIAAGLRQDDSVSHFIRSTYGALPTAALQAIVADPDDPQAASLRELLLFPGEAVVAALEPVLATADLDQAGAARLAERLAATVSQACAILPDGTRLRLALGPEEVRRFVSRLAPTRTLPAPARTLLAERFGPQPALELAVAARLTGPAWTPKATAFFTVLAGRLPAQDTPLALGGLRYALRFLADLPPEALPLPHLISRHNILSAQLRRAHQQEQALAGSNYETLILTGARLPYLHAPDISRELGLTEALILAATGRPAPDTGESCLDMGTVSDVAGWLTALDDQTD